MIPLDDIIDYIDAQLPFYEGEAKTALIRASDAIYDHLHKDDPEVEYGN